ncbi:hypothetical protein NQ315_010321 [Exocentrus adspersus]|uniref:Uncharacterized protein n=1 Tax=Exocentrus adspersus TaxID=1586481 RepID=A0AAV8WAT8_9CUCU|nr:hypothetical protein NQ315_010321 [Exocentrus adspersus]
METNILIKWCRICYSEFTNGINLFGEEARRSFLHAKIRRYLSLTIALEDKLPKMICNDCCLKLDNFHKFATMAIRNQEKMSKLIFCNVNNTDTKQTENKSLLHTYLTKGIKEKEVVSQVEVTEMEVRVDPMSILQCCLEGDDGINGNNDEEKKIDKEDAQSDTESGLQLENLSETENYSINKKQYSCSVCPRSFTSELALHNHSWSHSSYPKKNFNGYSNIPVVQYELENQTERSDSSTSSNDRDEADDESDYVDIAEEEFQNNKFSCPICGKIISTKGNLKVHLETHRPKGRYGCDICGRIFKTQCNLFRHKEYHGGVQYPCGVCGRVYPTNSTLRAHSITHSDLRPHKCPLCDKTFKRNQDLKFHINQHTGARPYQCPYCPKAFASSGNCFSHRKRMHPIEVERDRERAAKIMR